METIIKNLFIGLLLISLIISCKDKIENSKKNNIDYSVDSVLVIKKDIKIPHDIKFWIDEEQINSMKSDSSKYWDKYKIIAQIRKDSLSNLIHLSFKERGEMIKDSITYWKKNKKIALERGLHEIKRKDSLQKIIYPIDAILPFGPKFLGKLVKNKTNWFGFQIKRGDSLSKEQKRNKKDVNDAWKYFSKFNPDDDLYQFNFKTRHKSHLKKSCHALYSSLFF